MIYTEKVIKTGEMYKFWGWKKNERLFSTLKMYFPQHQKSHNSHCKKYMPHIRYHISSTVTVNLNVGATKTTIQHDKLGCLLAECVPPASI